MYPGELGPLRSSSSREAWEAFNTGHNSIPEQTAWARDWFRIYNDDLRAHLPVTAAYLPVRVMDTMIIVLSVPPRAALARASRLVLVVAFVIRVRFVCFHHCRKLLADDSA